MAKKWENNDKIVSEKKNVKRIMPKDKLMRTLIIISLLRSATYVPLDNKKMEYGEALECQLGFQTC